jgi:hypothetical protein
VVVGHFDRFYDILLVTVDLIYFCFKRVHHHNLNLEVLKVYVQFIVDVSEQFFCRPIVFEGFLSLGLELLNCS